MTTKQKLALGVLVLALVVAIAVYAMREPAEDLALADTSSGSSAESTAPRAVIPLPTGSRVRAPTPTKRARSNENT